VAGSQLHYISSHGLPTNAWVVVSRHTVVAASTQDYVMQLVENYNITFHKIKWLFREIRVIFQGSCVPMPFIEAGVGYHEHRL
jgi:hypothetical protein